MNKIIVAIGGGENGRTNSKGIKFPYETKEIDQEIVRLTNKDYPNFLFLPHSQIPFGEESEEKYYLIVKNIFESLGCNTRCLKIRELKENFNKAIEDVKWADIIYEGGGATIPMIKLWKETGFDRLLKEAYESSKVMCGISAGGICWFNSAYTDDPSFESVKVNRIYCLDFIDAYFSPHCNLKGKLDKVRNSLRYIDKVGILLSNCAAIEIVNDEYRIIKSNEKAFAYKTYWKKDVMIEEDITNNNEFKPLKELLTR